MSIIPEFETRLQEARRDYWLQIDSKKVSRSQRTITRIMDYPGYVPLFGGIPIGLIRMTGSLVVGIIASLGLFFAKIFGCESAVRECKFVIGRARDELGRGFLELVPFATLNADQSFSENHHASVSTTAHGKYVYRYEDALFATLYSVAPLATDENQDPLIPPAQEVAAPPPVRPAPRALNEYEIRSRIESDILDDRRDQYEIQRRIGAAILDHRRNQIDQNILTRGASAPAA